MPHTEPPLPHYSYPPLPKKGGPAPAPYVYQEFPRGVHNANGRSLIVESQKDLDDKLAQGWSLTPPPPPEPELETCPNCVRLKAKFDAAWKQVLEENEKLTADNEKLVAENAKFARKKLTPPIKAEAAE